MAPASLRALLAGLIDYAGLFPPAALPLTDTVRNYGLYRRSSDRWALGKLVVPAARLFELRELVAAHDAWPISALVGEDVLVDAERIAAIADATDVVVACAEVRASTVAHVRAVADALRGVREVYVELPLSDELPDLLSAVAETGLRAKMRTGGVTADAIPAARACVEFITGCVALDLPFKATAGLHHPMRGRYALTYAPDAPRAEMFGFLNVFLAAAFARKGVPASDVESVLVESDPRAFAFSDAGVDWRSLTLSIADIEATRRNFATTFGSCSFREPIDDLTQLGLFAQ